MKPDSEIKRDVEAELNWRLDVDQTDLAVKVNNGVVTLTGFVPWSEDQRHEDMQASAA
jgi:osmotically-inducible protein OsmY